MKPWICRCSICATGAHPHLSALGGGGAMWTLSIGPWIASPTPVGCGVELVDEIARLELNSAEGE